TAISNGPPPVTVGTSDAVAAATLARVLASSATSQQAIEILSVEMRWPLCARWLASVTGSYPGSNGLDRRGRSRTPICCRESLVRSSPDLSPSIPRLPASPKRASEVPRRGNPSSAFVENVFHFGGREEHPG